MARTMTCKFLCKEDLRSTLSFGLRSSNPQVLSMIFLGVLVAIP